MNSIYNIFTPLQSKLYTIHYNNESYKNTRSAILGSGSKPYRFSFFKIAEDSYLLTRSEDRKVLFFDSDYLEMKSIDEGITPVIIKPIEVQKGIYALSVQNQKKQKYICFDGYVLHEYYIALKMIDSIEEAAIWKINETRNTEKELTLEKLSKKGRDLNDC